MRWIIEALIVLLILGWTWHWYNSQTVPVGLVIEATPAPEVQGEPTKTVETPVRVFANSTKLKTELSLPARVRADPGTNVLASTRVTADSHPSTITTVINAEGVSETFIRREPLEWFAFKTTGRVGAYYGTTQDGAAGMILAEQDLIAVKALTFSAIGTVTQLTSPTPGVISTQGFVGLGARINW